MSRIARVEIARFKLELVPDAGRIIFSGLKEFLHKLLLPGLFIAVLAVSRIPGLFPPDFSAVYAFVFCTGVYCRGRLAWWLPLGTLLVTDIVLNVFWYGAGSGEALLLDLWNLLPVYMVYVLILLVGRQFSGRSSFLKLLSGSLLGAVLFYLIANTWAWLEIPAYAKTLAGWIQALWTGLPGLPPTWEFFRNTLLSAGAFTALFVTAEKMAPSESPADKTAGAREPEGQLEAEPEETGA